VQSDRDDVCDFFVSRYVRDIEIGAYRALPRTSYTDPTCMGLNQENHFKEKS